MATDTGSPANIEIDFVDSSDLVYDKLQPHQKKFWDVVETFLKMGVTPTPKIVNQALNKPIRTSWNGPLCKIRKQLMENYGYELVHHQRGYGSGNWRWEKKIT